MAKAIVDTHKGKISAEVTDNGELKIKAVLSVKLRIMVLVSMV